MKSKFVLFVLALVCLTSPLLADEGHHHLGPDVKSRKRVFSHFLCRRCAEAV